MLYPDTPLILFQYNFTRFEPPRIALTTGAVGVVSKGDALGVTLGETLGDALGVLLGDVTGVVDGETDGDVLIAGVVALIAGVVAAIAGNVAGDAFKVILAPVAGVISAAFTFGTEELPAAERKSVPAKSQASVFV